MSGYNCSIHYLRGKDNICADLLSHSRDASGDNDDPPVNVDDRNYLISVTNLNLFEPKEFALYKNADDSLVVYE